MGSADEHKYELARAQRLKLLAGECPGITGGGDCPVVKGAVIEVSPKMTLVVLRVDTNQAGWKLHYEVRDGRDPVRLIRRTPPVSVPKAEQGEPTRDAITRSHRESSYTSAPAQAITDAGEAVDELTQDRFTRESREGFRAQLERERRERAARRLDERLRNVQALARERGVDLSRKLASIERRIEAAEREVGRGDV